MLNLPNCTIVQLPNCKHYTQTQHPSHCHGEHTEQRRLLSPQCFGTNTGVIHLMNYIYMYFNILTKTQLLLPQASLYKEVDVLACNVWKPKHSFPGVFGWKKETRQANIKWAFIFERSSANGLLTLWSPGWSCFILKRGEHNRLGLPRGELSIREPFIYVLAEFVR